MIKVYWSQRGNPQASQRMNDKKVPVSVLEWLTHEDINKYKLTDNNKGGTEPWKWPIY